MHEEIAMLLNAFTEYAKEHRRRHLSRKKRKKEKQRNKKLAWIEFVYNYVLECDGLEVSAALERTKRTAPLAIVLNTNAFSVTRTRDMIGEVEFKNYRLNWKRKM